MNDGKAIFDACVERTVEELDHNGTGSQADYADMAKDLVRDLLQTIIDMTPSPRTVDELTYILKQADAA